MQHLLFGRVSVVEEAEESVVCGALPRQNGALGGAEEAHRRWPRGRSEQGFLLGERYSSERRKQGKG